MSDQQHTPLPEAPVSWTARYRSTQGYDCMLTLRGHVAGDVLRQAHELMGRMAAAVAGPNPAWCPVHGLAMRRREKDGQVWYSHKAPDGTWCRGKPAAEVTHAG